jgi:eukaryotic-like serine/threonine-protein kinase
MIEQLKPADRAEDVTGSAAAAPGSLGSPLGQVGDYRIIREVGRGGMGVVYEAMQESLGRHVALDILFMNGRRGPTRIERFRLEGGRCARLSPSAGRPSSRQQAIEPLA